MRGTLEDNGQNVADYLGVREEDPGTGDIKNEAILFKRTTCNENETKICMRIKLRGNMCTKGSEKWIRKQSTVEPHREMGTTNKAADTYSLSPKWK